jgi:hypothetical protein
MDDNAFFYFYIVTIYDHNGVYFMDGNIFDSDALEGMLKINIVIGENQLPVIKPQEHEILFCSSKIIKETYSRWLMSSS